MQDRLNDQQVIFQIHGHSLHNGVLVEDNGEGSQAKLFHIKIILGNSLSLSPGRVRFSAQPMNCLFHLYIFSACEIHVHFDFTLVACSLAPFTSCGDKPPWMIDSWWLKTLSVPELITLWLYSVLKRRRKINSFYFQSHGKLIVQQHDAGQSCPLAHAYKCTGP